MTRFTFLLLLIVLLVAQNTSAQPWGWALDGFAGSESKSVVYNQSGEAYVCGHITSSTNFTAAVTSAVVAGGSHFSVLFVLCVKVLFCWQDAV
mgnify:CR=1 FL=1